MCETPRHKELLVFNSIQDNRKGFSKGFRIFSNIYNYVQNPTFYNSYKFGLCHFPPLKMKPSKNSLGRNRLVILNKIDPQARDILKGLSVISFPENTPLVLKNTRL